MAEQERIALFWCMTCKTYRVHVITEGTEKGTCVNCKTVNWMPTGDIG